MISINFNLKYWQAFKGNFYSKLHMPQINAIYHLFSKKQTNVISDSLLLGKLIKIQNITTVLKLNYVSPFIFAHNNFSTKDTNLTYFCRNFKNDFFNIYL